MTICSNNHSEIIHNEKLCPLCDKMSDLESAEETIADLQDTIKDLESQLKEQKP
jgi:transcription initiation factor IIE alpha subunit